MRYHPAALMLFVWSSAFACLLVLPFRPTFRTIEIEGLLALLAFLVAFSLGAVMRTIHLPQQPVSSPQLLQMRRADALLKFLAMTACVTLGHEVLKGVALDLDAAYLSRSTQAQALLQGGDSHSSGLFKIGFVCYPAGYVFLVRALLLEVRPRWRQVFLFGVLPPVLAGLAMGGRTPIFNVMAYGALAFAARGVLYGGGARRIHGVAKTAALLLGLVMLKYFIDVFVVRAEQAGGVEAMLDHAAAAWGMTFAGQGAEIMLDVLGETATYLVFVFVWYLIQGTVISNSLFVNYEGDALWGIYGIDVFTGIARRLDPEGVSEGFNYLLGLDSYGFLPSAFGSLYVDFYWGGLIFAFVWGWLAAVVYRNTRRGRDARWFLFVPFVTLGVVFSLINTPLGYSNGFITHFWLVVTFLLIRRRRHGPHGRHVPSGTEELARPEPQRVS